MRAEFAPVRRQGGRRRGPALHPFFDENQGLGHDARIRSLPVHGSLQQGDSPGLYGGTRQPTICDVEKLKEFLTDPANHCKAQAWAGAFGIGTEQIPDYLDRLTPVLLRHDTLVENHDYKSGTAAPFDSLLQSGIAVLVDRRGQPAVKCSCGNPLRPFTGDTGRTKVEFDHGNRRWRGYDRVQVTAVRPAARPLERLALVDVADPGRGIERPVGTTGAQDAVFRTGERHAVPEVTGTSFGEASRRLSDAGLAVAYDGAGLPPGDARVLASDPVAGTELRFGEYVTLRVADGSGDGNGNGNGSSDSSRGGGAASPAGPGSPPIPPPSAPSPSGAPSSVVPPPSPQPTSREPSAAPPSSPSSDPGTPSRAAPPDVTHSTDGAPPDPPGSSPAVSGSAPSAAPVTSEPASSGPTSTAGEADASTTMSRRTRE
ncbi:PASTA domain-containing protein [Streptomyces sp. NPDC048417]|uniref:PASTA domain-containing protein n=1 Tax=Streptomyces sp. NPDC048417 TaxID=3155387 RepID=UPI0034244905